MTEAVNVYLKRIPLILVAALGSPVLKADIGTSFSATYEVFIDGKPRLETRIAFQRQGDSWQMTSESRGTHGLPKMLRASSAESSSGSLVDQQFRPDTFNHASSIAGRQDHWDATFNWEQDLVSTRHEDGVSSLALAGAETDPLSLTMKIRESLAMGRPQFSTDVVDEDEISRHDYQSGPAENLSTALGCLRAVPVERIRENSKRYSTGWYAESLGYIPVRVVHGKKGGKEFDMKIISLTLDDQPVSGAGDCPL